nr:hypothetical protein [Candidatus Sigynarchaeota archaeon]
MKGSIGIGMIVGIIASIFLPYVFALINYDGAFGELNSAFQGLGALTGLPGVLSAAFAAPGSTPSIGAGYATNIIAAITGSISPLQVLSGILTWVVLGLLAGLFTQSPKKGVISAVVFVIVEILIYMLTAVLAGNDIMNDILMQGNPELVDGLVAFLGRVIIVPVGVGIAGGVVGGLISQFAFGPEEI